MTGQVRLHVEGTPAPQGSKVRTRYGMRESSKRLKPWRDLVKQAASIKCDELALLGPLQPPYRVEMWFYIRKPRTTRNPYPTAPTIGDLDKLVRGVLDGLTQGGLLEDDRFVVKHAAEKEWAAASEEPGVVIYITEGTG